MIFRFPTEDITPFVHALVGGESVSSTYYPSNKWGIVLTVGGGIDYNTPWLDHHLAIRVFQADYQYTHDNFYPVARGNFNMARLSTGVVVELRHHGSSSDGNHRLRRPAELGLSG